MTVIIRAIVAASASAAASAAITAMSSPPPTGVWPRLWFPPDLLMLADLLFGGGSPIAAAALAGGVAGIACSLVLTGRKKAGVSALALALFNPLTLYAYSLGASAALALAAGLVVARALSALIATPGHEATVAVGISVAAAPLISSVAVALIPLILFLTPVLSPWGASPRKLVGFIAAILAPLGMTCLAILYLYWLLGAPDTLRPAMALPPEDTLLIFAGAILIAIAGTRAAAQGAACSAGAIILFFARPELPIFARIGDLGS
jgi:hypothetical protein